MPVRAEVVLSDEEREVLERWARRPTSAQALALRCRIVLAAADGEKSFEIAERLGCTRSTVGKWRGRFAERGLDGLHDEPRPGKPRQITDEDIERVIVKTLEEQPKNATHWSTRSMAAATGMSQTAISRIWRAFGLKPHRTEHFKLSPDPQFIDKVRDIIGLYLNPPEAAVVRWLKRHPRFTLHFTPTYSSWLNLVERWFAELTTKWLKRSAHRSVRDLVASIRTWATSWNEDPKPYVWHKSADEILDSLAAYCQRISDSGH
jgi:transposase